MSLADFKSFVERVRDKAKTHEVISKDAKLEKVGSLYKCFSPLRDEKDPSFFIYPDGGWHDFGTNESGDVFEYVMKRDDIGFAEAVRVLGKQYGLEYQSSDGGISNPKVKEFLENNLERRYISKIITAAAHYYHERLPDKVRAHLREHYGFSDETINEFRIGWADGNLLRHLKNKTNFDEKKLLKSGLFIQFNDNSIIELFNKRIVFPYWKRGYAEYMIGRRLDGETLNTDYEKAKYKKLLTHSDKHPYISEWVSNDVFFGEDSVSTKPKAVVITEGVTDAISCLSIGMPCISPVTIRFKKSDINRLIRLTENVETVYVVNDEEKPRLDQRTGIEIQPGLQAATETVQLLVEAGRDARLVRFPRPDNVEKVDLNSFIKEHGSEEFLRLLPEAKPYVRLVIEQLPVKPNNLDNALAPVCKLLSNCGVGQRESYIDDIAKQMQIRRTTINKTLAAHTREHKQSSSDNDGFRGDKGSIREDVENNCYYISTESNESNVSTFRLVPKEKIISQTQDVTRCDIYCRDGEKIENADFPSDCWQSKRDFMKNLTGISTKIQWMGTDDNIQGLSAMLSKTKVSTYRGTDTLGYHLDPKGDLYVAPDMVIGKDGPIENPPIRYIPNGNSLEEKIHYEFFDQSKIKEFVQEFIPLVMNMNEHHVTIPLIGMTMASFFAPLIRSLEGHHPVLFLWGTAGSGKTSMMRDIFWPMTGIVFNREPFSSTATHFVMIKNAAASNSHPIYYDEFKGDMGPRHLDKCMRIIRQNYDGESEGRGKQNLKVVNFKLSAPHFFVGEIIPTETAILERVICVTPSKNAINEERANMFHRAASMGPGKIAGEIVKLILNSNASNIIKLARKIVKNLQLGDIPARIESNIVIMVSGLVLWLELARLYDVNVPDFDLKVICKQLINNVYCNADTGSVNDALDKFLESLCTYARTGHLKQDVHYTVIERKRTEEECVEFENQFHVEVEPQDRLRKKILALHIKSSYEVYLEQRRKTLQPDETNGYNALRRVINEKHERKTSYIENVGSVIKLGGTPTRVLEIDIEKAKRLIDFYDFPYIGDFRRHGGYNRFSAVLNMSEDSDD